MSHREAIKQRRESGAGGSTGGAGAAPLVVLASADTVLPLVPTDQTLHAEGTTTAGSEHAPSVEEVEECAICESHPCQCAVLVKETQQTIEKVPVLPEYRRARIHPRGTKFPRYGDVPWAPLTLTRFTCDTPEAAQELRKRVKLDEAGNIQKLDVKGFWNGAAHYLDGTLKSFIEELMLPEDKRPLHAFYAAGVHAASREKPLRMGGKDKVSRSKDTFPFPEANALLTIDADEVEFWPQLKTAEDVVDVLHQLGLEADCGTSPSGSSFLECPNEKRGLRGLHVFFAIDQGTEVPRVLEVIHKRAWLNGFGRIKVGGDGRLHERSVVDRALASPNQPIFEFGAVLLDTRIKQPRKVSPHRYPNPDPMYRQVVAARIRPLTAAEEAEYVRLVESAKADVSGEAEQAEEAWLDRQTAGISPQDVERVRAALLESRDNVHRDLSPDFPITRNDGSVVFVRDIVADPDKFAGEGIPDPFEPEYGRSKATIVTKGQRDGRPKIISRAHGGSITYYLTPRPGRAAEDESPELFDADGKRRNLQPFPDPPNLERPKYLVLDDWTEIPAIPPGETDFGPQEGAPARPQKPGLYLFDRFFHRGSGDWINTDTWICGPLHIEAQTRDGLDNNFGRLLKFKTSAGGWRRWPLPMETLGGAAAGVTQILFGLGLVTSGTMATKQKIVEYIASSMPDQVIRCVPQIGWTDDTFVLPDRIVGPAAADIVLQSPYIAELNEMHGTAGSFDGWRAGVAGLAVGNDWLVLGLSAAFAGPLLKRTRSGSGGIHFMGNSSTGKTTILDAACSVWGGSEYKRTWLTTSNGLEGVAAMSNDCLLALDEISQCEPQQIGNVIYMLGNGVGKQRANRNGAARTPIRHKTVVISTGEKTIADAMLEGGKRVKAGQGVRLIDVRVSGCYGCFDELHGYATGKHFVDAIAAAASSHYGHAGRRFLEALVKDEQDLVARLAEIRKLPEFNPEHADGQRERVASRFALFALAGELASEYGVTGWAPGTATQAAARAFVSWDRPRGQGSTERQQALTSILAFLERHGDSRFSDSKKPEGAGPAVRDRAGWFRDVKVGADQEIEREYLFHSEGMREALAGADINGAIRALVDAGVLPPPDEKGKHAKVIKIGGTATRVYPILPRKVQSALDGERDEAEVREYDPFDDE